jgi:hypothetical protein
MLGPKTPKPHLSLLGYLNYYHFFLKNDKREDCFFSAPSYSGGSASTLGGSASNLAGSTSALVGALR